MKNILLFIITFTFILVSCGNNTNPHKEDKENAMKGLRIISLVPSITKEIEQLGLIDQVVGATSFCDISKKNPKLIVGSAISINEEKILLLKPDIVFSSTLTKPESEEILRKNGIKIVSMNKLSSFDDICTHYIALGKELDKEQTATEFVTKSRKKLDSIISTIPKTEERPRIFFQLGAKPLVTVLSGTFMNDFIIFANADNIYSDISNIIVSRESVVLRNPSHIIISSMGSICGQEKIIWNDYPDIDAVRNNNIFKVESVSTPTVAAFVKHFEIIKNELYGK